jgi:DNA polymerase III subunit delta
MRIKAEQLEAHLKRNLAPLYVVTGDEPLLALEAADTVRTAARAQGYTERQVLHVEGAFSWAQLREAGGSLSLFGERKLIEVRMPSGKPGTEGATVLAGFCQALPPDTITLVTLPRLDRQGQSAKWFKALEDAGVVVPVYAVERGQLPQWIGARLAAQGQRASREALAFLADMVEGNLLAAHQELQKLGLLYPAGELSFAQVEQAVLPVARFDPFKLVDAILDQDVARLVRILEALRAEGVFPLQILGPLANQVRQLLKLKQAQASGANMATAMRDARVWESRQAQVRRALGRLDRPVLRQALLRAALIDRQIKGLASGDVWDELLQLSLQLAQAA